MNFGTSNLFAQLLKGCPLSHTELTILVTTAPFRYKSHYIQKRNGRGRRLISQPTAELKFVQRLLIATELRSLPVHAAAKAYRAGGSIADHAAPHANAKYLLKLDFVDFFPSLKAASIISALNKDLPALTESDTFVISQLLCRKDLITGSLQLSIGAPSSPFISNYLLFDFDSALDEICRRHAARYTRYADDIAISTSQPRILDSIKRQVEELLASAKGLSLSLNESKTVNVSRKWQRTLTGLVLSNEGNASLGRAKKRNLRAAIHTASIGGEPEMGVPKLRGMLAFAYSIDPLWVTQMCRKYNFASISDIEVRRDK